MKTTFDIDNEMVMLANSVVTVVNGHDGKFYLHVTKSRSKEQTDKPIVCDNREEFAKMLVRIMFDEKCFIERVI